MPDAHGLAEADLIPGTPEFEASLEARRRADQVLRTLMAESALLDARLADSGRLDPIRAVSGRSAMERAIEVTRSTLGALDRLLQCQAGRQAVLGRSGSQNGRGRRFPASTVQPGRA